MNISFSLTIKRAKQLNVPDPLLCGIKTVSRRNWKEATYDRICNQFDRGFPRHIALSSMPFVVGSEKCGEIVLTTRPYRERIEDMPDADLYHEGNLWKSKQDFIQSLKICPNTLMTVIRFEFTPIGVRDYPSFQQELDRDFLIFN